MRANRIYILLLIAVMFSSCGTILSNIELSNAIKKNGKDNIVCWKTDPFIYSGVKLENTIVRECVLNDNTTGCSNILGIVGFDYLLSFLADTAILPYSIYRQNKYCWSRFTDNTIK